jgi:hypothetical protein
MASGTGLFRLDSLSWDEELLEILEVRAESLPELSEAAAGLLPGSGRRFPELASVPWLTALGDGALANLGSAWTVVNRRALTLETSGALRVLCRAIRQSSFRTGCGATCSIAKFLKDDRWSSSIRRLSAPRTPRAWTLTVKADPAYAWVASLRILPSYPLTASP